MSEIGERELSVPDPLVRLWKWHGIDYFLEFATITVLLIGAVKVSEARATLNQDGCKAYWAKYHGVNASTENVTFVNKSGRKENKNARSAHDGYQNRNGSFVPTDPSIKRNLSLQELNLTDGAG